MKKRERRGGLYRTWRSRWLPRPVSPCWEKQPGCSLSKAGGHLRRGQTPDVWGLHHGGEGGLPAAEGSAQRSNGSQALVSGPLNVLKQLGDLKGLLLFESG